MPKVSVLVPVYGVEKYIERCARSLFEQTLDDLEFIFVDDCTPDKSIEILRSIIEEYQLRFAKKRYTVRIERMPMNSGLAAVRQHGIHLATGDYIIHCDSDDWVDATMYEKMYNTAIEEGSDVVVCDYYISDENKSIPKIGCHNENKWIFYEKILKLVDSPSVWNKLFHKSLYQNSIIYPIYPMAEDLVLTSQLLWYCKSISYVHCPLYYYYSNFDSISKKTGETNILKRFNQSVSNMSLLFNFYQDKKMPNNIKAAFLLALIHQRDRLLPIIDKNEYYRLWKDTFPQINRELIINPKIPFKKKIGYILVRYKLYPLVNKIRKIFL